MSEKEINVNVPLVDGLTPSEIEKMKRTHKTKNVYFIEVTTKPEEIEVGEELAKVEVNRGEVIGQKGETFCFWFKKIDMVVFSAASKYVENDPVKATRIIIDNTLIKGDKSATNDVDVFSVLSPKLLGTLGKASATIKKF